MAKSKSAAVWEVILAALILITEVCIVRTPKLKTGVSRATLGWCLFNLALSGVTVGAYKMRLERQEMTLVQAVRGGGWDAAHCAYTVAAVATASAELAFITLGAAFFEGWVEYVPVVIALVIFVLSLFEMINEVAGYEEIAGDDATATGSDCEMIMGE